MSQIVRCEWANSSDNMKDYHDSVWGRPELDDTALFRKLSLDLMQAGLSWQTILNKSESFDNAFDSFNIKKVKNYLSDDIERLLADTGIVRNRLKIMAIINNANVIFEMHQEGKSFYEYLSQQIPNGRIVNQWQEMADIPASTQLSDCISKQMKKDGFKFIGTTIIYSFLQAAGFINDHIESCFCYKDIIEKEY